MMMMMTMTMPLQMLIEEEDPSLLNAFRQSNQIAVEVTHHHCLDDRNDDNCSLNQRHLAHEICPEEAIMPTYIRFVDSKEATQWHHHVELNICSLFIHRILT